MSILGYYSKHIVESGRDKDGNEFYALHQPMDLSLSDIEMHEKFKNEQDTVKLSKPIEVFSHLTFAICAAKMRCAIQNHIEHEKQQPKPDFTQIRLIEKTVTSVFSGINQPAKTDKPKNKPTKE